MIIYLWQQLKVYKFTKEISQFKAGLSFFEEKKLNLTGMAKWIITPVKDRES
jgi:hypothetical protein